MPDLDSTTLTDAVGDALKPGMRFTSVPLASIANVHKGDWFFCEGEGMAVIDHTVNPVKVMRGRVGRLSSHPYGATVYIGPPTMFRSVNPIGIPPIGAFSPWINTTTGEIWFAQGDEVGPGTVSRYWQKQVVGPRVPGALGVLGPVPTTP